MAQKRAKKPRFVSPAGVLVFPHLNRPDTKFKDDGEYHCKLRLSDAEFADLKARIDEKTEAAVEEAKTENPKVKKQITTYFPYQEETDDDGEPTGNWLVSFKQNAKIRLRDGTVKAVTIPIFDSQGNVVDTDVWGGSVAKVSFTFRNIWVAGTKTAGVRLDLGAAQIIKLVQGGQQSAEGYGFGKEDDGFVADNSAGAHGFDEDDDSGDDDGDEGDF